MTRKLQIDVYVEGVVITMSWTDSEMFRRITTFLEEMGASGGSASEGERPFYYLESRQQLDALYDFRRALREKHSGSLP